MIELLAPAQTRESGLVDARLILDHLQQLRHLNAREPLLVRHHLRALLQLYDVLLELAHDRLGALDRVRVARRVHLAVPQNGLVVVAALATDERLVVHLSDLLKEVVHLGGVLPRGYGVRLGVQ